MSKLDVCEQITDLVMQYLGARVDTDYFSSFFEVYRRIQIYEKRGRAPTIELQKKMSDIGGPRMTCQHEGVRDYTAVLEMGAMIRVEYFDDPEMMRLMGVLEMCSSKLLKTTSWVEMRE